MEFPYLTETDVEDVCYNVKLLGLIPVVAHVERYFYLRNEESIFRLKEIGAVIQVNADTIVAKPFSKERKFVKKLLKHRLVDVVASDSHYLRQSRMADAYSWVKSKHKEYADLIFDINPTHIVTVNK